MQFISDFCAVCCFYLRGYFQIFQFFFFTTFFVIRAKIKAEREAEALLSSGPGEPRSTHSKQHKDENAVTAQRAKWREWKSKEHSKWTAQRWRRHRERNLHAYYARKAPEKGTKITPRFSLWHFNCHVSRTVVVVKFMKDWLEFVRLKMFKKVRNL